MSKPAKNFIFLTICLSPLASYAMFCPNNFNLIHEGDTIEQVQQACGKPDKTTTAKVPATPAPQQWQYFPSATGDANRTIPMNFVIENGKVVNISVNGIGAAKTNRCGNQTINIGDSADKVKAACGASNFITQAQNNNDTTNANKTAETNALNYQTANGTSTLKFVNGKLQNN